MLLLKARGHSGVLRVDPAKGGVITGAAVQAYGRHGLALLSWVDMNSLEAADPAALGRLLPVPARVVVVVVIRR
jgi:hypothetical protein